MRVAQSPALAVVVALLHAAPAFATHDPNTTVTIWVHGFDSDGPAQAGVFGEDSWDASMTPFSDAAGLPNIGQPGEENLPNVVAATEYYGDTVPSYYTPSDIAELDAVTAQWGGGIPRYALIVAKYAQHLLARTGASQVNFFSGSFGTYVTHWLIEKDVEGLAGSGAIARWLSAEGVLCGNWVASNGVLSGLWDQYGTPSIDTDQMDYAWCEANLHSPRTDADSPLYAGILMGSMGSVNGETNDGTLSDALLLEGEPQANDGVVTLADSHFSTVAPAARFLGKMPTESWYHEGHDTLADCPAAWAQSAEFLTGARRVTVRIDRMQVTDIHEPDLPWWDWTPAEILVQSRVFSPLLEAEGVGPVSIRHRDGINAPLYDWNAEGDTQVLGQIVFDDFLREDETELRIDLWAEELDWLLEYEVTETIGIGSEIDAMGTGTVTVPVTGAGTYAFNAGDWNCDLTVEVFTYPFPPLVTGTSAEAVAVAAPGLAIHPNPFRESVMIRTPAGSDPASMLTIHDVSGRLVHRVRLRESVHTWDGRDAAGRAVPAGVYFLRAQSEAGEATGRCLRVR